MGRIKNEAISSLEELPFKKCSEGLETADHSKKSRSEKKESEREDRWGTPNRSEEAKKRWPPGRFRQSWVIKKDRKRGRTPAEVMIARPSLTKGRKSSEAHPEGVQKKKLESRSQALI